MRGTQRESKLIRSHQTYSLRLSASASAPSKSSGSSPIGLTCPSSSSYLMREAIRGHQRSSEVIRSHHRSSEVIILIVPIVAKSRRSPGGMGWGIG